MINETDTYKKLIKFLKEIDEEYLPIVHKEYDSVDDHIKEFLELFKDQEGHGLIAFVPIFLEIRNWNKWDIDFGGNYYGIAYCDPQIFNTKYTAEDYLYKISGLGFSQTILKSQNSRDEKTPGKRNGRKTLVISKGLVNDEDGYVIDANGNTCSRKLKMSQFRKLAITQAASLDYVIL